MKERILLMGEQRATIGILTEPDPSALVPHSPIAVILNAGIVHRIGPFRMHVDLSRALAQAGFRSLRIDLSGLGDSPNRPGKNSAEDSAILDGMGAFDKLGELTGTHQFVLMGLCSGAYHSHRLSCQDPRVIGAVFIDGIAFPTKQHRRRVLLNKLRPRFWRNAVKRRVLGLMPLNAAQSAGERLASIQFFGNNLSQSAVSQELKTFIERKLRMLVIYTGGYSDVSSSSQFREMFHIQPDQDQIQVVYYPDAEHTFPLIDSRRLLINRIVSWISTVRSTQEPISNPQSFAGASL